MNLRVACVPEFQVQNRLPIGALVLKVREGGRVVNVHALIAVGVKTEGYREILGIDVTTAEDGAG